MKTIVSLTELPLAADSRTLKMAASFARAGFRSIVLDASGDCCGMPSGVEVRQAPLARVVTEATQASQAIQAPRSRLRLPSLVDPLLHPLRLLVEMKRMRDLDGSKQAGEIPGADLYYVHGPRFSGAIRERASRSGTPIIYDAHDYHHLLRKSVRGGGFHDWFLVPYHRAREAALVRSAAAMVTVSDGLADLLSSEFGRRPEVVRNCHDSRLDDCSVEPLRKRLALSADKVIVACVGHCKPGFAVETMLDVLARLPPTFVLVVLGKGWERLEADAAQRGLSGRLIWIPPVPPTHVVPLLASADVGWLPHRAINAQYRVALPNGFFQCISAGIPLVFSAQLPECVSAALAIGVGTPVDPDDVDGVANSLMSAAERRGKETASLKEAASRLSWRHEEDVLLKIVARTI